MRFRPLSNARRPFGETRFAPIVLRTGRELESSVSSKQTREVPCNMAEQFESHEVGRIRAALAGGFDPVCPRCGGRFDRTDVPPRNDVPYVRDRIWLICATCGAGLVIDRPKTPPG